MENQGTVRSQLTRMALAALAAVALLVAYDAVPVKAEEGTGCFICSWKITFCPGGGCPNHTCVELDREEHAGASGNNGCLAGGIGGCYWDDENDGECTVEPLEGEG